MTGRDLTLSLIKTVYHQGSNVSKRKDLFDYIEFLSVNLIKDYNSKTDVRFKRAFQTL